VCVRLLSNKFPPSIQHQLHNLSNPTNNNQSSSSYLRNSNFSTPIPPTFDVTEQPGLEEDDLEEF